MHTFEIFKAALVIDFLRYFIAAAIAYLLFWVLFKNQWRHRIIQWKGPSFKKMWFEFRYSISTVVIFAIIGTIIISVNEAGHTLIYEQLNDYPLWWFPMSVILMILMHDTWFYWTHRWMHHPRIFRHVHLIHHRSTNPSPWAAYSFHPVEAIVEAGIFPLIVFTIPAHELALVTFLIYMITRNVIGHLGIEFLPKWFIHNKWINWHTTTTHHDMHHKHFDSNYGLYFTWWDRWLGTEHEAYTDTFEEVVSREKENTYRVRSKTKKGQ